MEHFVKKTMENFKLNSEVEFLHSILYKILFSTAFITASPTWACLLIELIDTVL